MWAGDKIFYSSDNGSNSRYNLWMYDTNTGANTQITNYTEYDVHYPSLGPKDIIYENEGKLYLMDLATQQRR